MSELVTTAIGYAQRGWPVFPVATDKSPIASLRDSEGRGGFYAATTDVAEVRRMFDAHPDTLIACRTGGSIWALDVDLGGDETLRGLGIEAGVEDFDSGWTTPSGGYQVLFEQRDGHEIHCGTDVLGPKIDIRGEGGYTILPGPTVADYLKSSTGERHTGCYEWADGDEAPAALPSVALRAPSDDPLEAQSASVFDRIGQAVFNAMGSHGLRGGQAVYLPRAPWAVSVRELMAAPCPDVEANPDAFYVPDHLNAKALDLLLRRVNLADSKVWLEVAMALRSTVYTRDDDLALYGLFRSHCENYEGFHAYNNAKRWASFCGAQAINELDTELTVSGGASHQRSPIRWSTFKYHAGIVGDQDQWASLIEESGCGLRFQFKTSGSESDLTDDDKALRDAAGLGNAPIPTGDESSDFVLPDIAPFPPAILDSDGLVGEIARYTMRRARYGMAPLAVMGALTTLSALTARRYVYQENDSDPLLGTLFALGTVATGAGKDDHLRLPRELLVDAGCDYLIAPEERSPQALRYGLHARPVQWHEWDEFGSKFAKMTARKGGFGDEWLEVLLKTKTNKFWPVPNLVAMPEALQGAKPSHRPVVTLHAVSTPQTFLKGAVAMGNEFVESGVANRFLWFHVPDDCIPLDENPGASDPTEQERRERERDDLVRRLKGLAHRGSTVMGLEVRPPWLTDTADPSCHFRRCRPAQEVLEHALEWTRSYRSAAMSGLSTQMSAHVRNRMVADTRVVALLLHVGLYADHPEPESFPISMTTWTMARDLVLWCVDTMDLMCHANLSRTVEPADAQLARRFAALEAQMKRGGVSRIELSKARRTTLRVGKGKGRRVPTMEELQAFCRDSADWSIEDGSIVRRAA